VIEKPTSLYEKACQLIFARLGSNLPPVRTAEEDVERVEALLEDCPLGGLIFFNGQWPDSRATLARVQKKSRFPLLVGADIERGIGQEVRGATLFPHAMAFGAIEGQNENGEDAEALVEESARVTAREGRACGIHITFAPVADVNLTPKNPIIATRAFGDEPNGVAHLVRAYLRGCKDEGMLTTPKHFPGHGRTTADPHAEQPVVEASREELEETDFLPFRAAFDAGAELVMTAHVAYPALTGNSETPATGSDVILKGLLRDDMGFEGPVVSDSLIMGAVKDSHESPAALAAAVVEAGVDLLLDPDDPEAIARGLVKAVEDGTLSEARIDEALDRVWRLKERLVERDGRENAFPTAAEHSAEQSDKVGSEEHQRLAKRIARGAVTVLDNSNGALPLSAEQGEKMVFIRLAAGEHADNVLLAKSVQETFPQAHYYAAGPDVEERELDILRQEAADADTVVLALRVEPAAWHAFGLTPSQQRFADAIVDEHPTVVAALGSPHVLDDFPGATARLCAFSDVPASQEALVVALTQAT
jgi:beta-glucosidase-like glycosyl hydrolase